MFANGTERHRDVGERRLRARVAARRPGELPDARAGHHARRRPPCRCALPERGVIAGRGRGTLELAWGVREARARLGWASRAVRRDDVTRERAHYATYDA